MAALQYHVQSCMYIILVLLIYCQEIPSECTIAELNICLHPGTLDEAKKKEAEIV